MTQTKLNPTKPKTAQTPRRKQPTFLRGKVTTEHYDDIPNRRFKPVKEKTR